MLYDAKSTVNVTCQICGDFQLAVHICINHNSTMLNNCSIRFESEMHNSHYLYVLVVTHIHMLFSQSYSLYTSSYMELLFLSCIAVLSLCKFNFVSTLILIGKQYLRYIIIHIIHSYNLLSQKYSDIKFAYNCIRIPKQKYLLVYN